jgi:hypothetical protein
MVDDVLNREAPRQEAGWALGPAMRRRCRARRANTSAIWVRTVILETVSIYYYLIKITFFYALVRSQVKYDLVKDHYLFLGILYTAAVAFLSLAFLSGLLGEDFPRRYLEYRVSKALGVSLWRAWLIETLLLSSIYFKLMARFDEGVVFWTLLMLGIFVAIF